MLNQWKAFQNLASTLPTMQLHAASSGAIKGVILFFPDIQYPSRAVNIFYIFVQNCKSMDLPFNRSQTNLFSNETKRLAKHSRNKSILSGILCLSIVSEIAFLPLNYVLV